MKSYLKTIILISLAAVAFEGCNIENLEVPQTPRKINLTVVAETSSPITKATMGTYGEETDFVTRWENGDKIDLFTLQNSEFSYLSSFEWRESDRAFYDYFGYVYENTSPVDIVGVYPWFEEDGEIDSYCWTIDFSGDQRYQNGSKYNSDYDVMVSQNVSTSLEEDMTVFLPMERVTAIQYFHLTSSLDEDEMITSATLEVDGANIAGWFYLNGPEFDNISVVDEGNYGDFPKVTVKEFGYSKFGYVADSPSITICPEGLSANDFKLWFNVLPVSYNSMTLTIETENGYVATLTKSSGGSFVAGDLYKVSMDVVFSNEELASIMEKPVLPMLSFLVTNPALPQGPQDSSISYTESTINHYGIPLKFFFTNNNGGVYQTIIDDSNPNPCLFANEGEFIGLPHLSAEVEGQTLNFRIAGIGFIDDIRHGLDNRDPFCENPKLHDFISGLPSEDADVSSVLKFSVNQGDSHIYVLDTSVPQASDKYDCFMYVGCQSIITIMQIYYILMD